MRRCARSVRASSARRNGLCHSASSRSKSREFSSQGTFNGERELRGQTGALDYLIEVLLGDAHPIGKVGLRRPVWQRELGLNQGSRAWRIPFWCEVFKTSPSVFIPCLLIYPAARSSGRLSILMSTITKPAVASSCATVQGRSLERRARARPRVRLCQGEVRSLRRLWKW